MIVMIIRVMIVMVMIIVIVMIPWSIEKRSYFSKSVMITPDAEIVSDIDDDDDDDWLFLGLIISPSPP